MTDDPLEGVLDDVKATAERALLDFAEVEKVFMRRHRGRPDVARMALLLRGDACADTHGLS